MSAGSCNRRAHRRVNQVPTLILRADPSHLDEMLSAVTTPLGECRDSDWAAASVATVLTLTQMKARIAQAMSREGGLVAEIDRTWATA